MACKSVQERKMGKVHPAEAPTAVAQILGLMRLVTVMETLRVGQGIGEVLPLPNARQLHNKPVVSPIERTFHARRPESR